MKKIIYIFSITSMFFGCSDYTDLGENPNQLHTDQAQPDQYISAAQTMSYSLQASTMERLGLLFSNTCGGNVQSFAAPFNNELTFNMTTTFYSTIFSSIYLNTNSYQKIIDYNDTNQKFVEFKAMAKIGKVYNMQYLVDLYGDVPYKEIFQGINNPRPKYDDDFYVYQQLFNELDEARTLINDLNNSVYPASTGESASTDMIFGGDMTKWKLFANTIELKMLVRMSNCTGAAATYRDTRLANMVANNYNSFITSDVTIQPGYNSGRSDTMNPMFSSFVCDNLGNVSSYTLFCPSGHIAKCLNLYANINYPSPASQEVITGSSTGMKYPNVADPRRGSMFANPTSMRAVTQGSTIVDVFKPGPQATSQPSRLAGYFFNLYDNAGVGSANIPVSLATGKVKQSEVDKYGAGKGYIMTMAECYFLQAEAAHLASTVSGYAVLGLNAQANFTSGVDASMLQYKVTSANANTYKTQISSTSTSNLKYYYYNTSNSYSENYHAIMYQKWLAVVPSNAIECYLDNTRTGYPATPLPLNNSFTSRPKRLLYPNSEYIANSTNVPNVTSSDVFSINSYSPFWLQ